MIGSIEPMMVEERMEDAVVLYLSTEIDGIAKVKPGFDNDGIELPCVAVGALSSSEPEESRQTGHRNVELRVSVITRAAKISDDLSQYQNARELHAVIKAKVMQCLYVESLQVELNAQNVPTLVVSQCYVEQLNKKVDRERLVTEITLSAVAHTTLEP